MGGAALQGPVQRDILASLLTGTRVLGAVGRSFPLLYADGTSSLNAAIRKKGEGRQEENGGPEDPSPTSVVILGDGLLCSPKGPEDASWGAELCAPRVWPRGVHGLWRAGRFLNC